MRKKTIMLCYMDIGSFMVPIKTEGQKKKGKKEKKKFMLTF